MNKQQKNYALAKAAYELAREEIAKHEQAFIARENIRNPDGSVPASLWMLECDDEEYFNALCDKLYSSEGFSALCDEESEARKVLHDAEEELIDYGLSLPMPPDVRQTLHEHRNDWKVHDKLIDLTFRLNTRTVRAGGRV